VKREGTGLDMRALLMHELMGLLLDAGIPAARIRTMKRWDRVKLLRKIQNEQATLLRNTGTAASLQAAALNFVDDSKATSVQKHAQLAEQAPEIQRRQAAVLSSPVEPDLGVEDAEDNDVSGWPVAAPAHHDFAVPNLPTPLPCASCDGPRRS